MVRKKFGLPNDEELFDDFACNLKQLPNVPVDLANEAQNTSSFSEITAQRGRLFLSENYICFATDVFGVQSQTKIAFTELIKIQKSKFLGLFDSGVMLK